MKSNLFSALVLLVFAAPSPAEIAFPADSGVVDVTKAPYLAKGDGKADDTKAIQKAIDDHPNSGAIIFLPAGTYLISDTLTWAKGSRGGMEWKNIILQGAGQKRTTLRLKDSAEGFGDTKTPKAMLWTGRKPAQRFRNGVRDLTIETGAGNPGAIGAQFMANNQGTFRDVTLRAGSASGPIGLDLGYSDENGPCLIKNVTVIGFEMGIRTAFAVDSLIFENITLEKQSKFGLHNNGQCLSIRSLTSKNEVPALFNAKGPGLVAIIDSQLTGTGKAKDVPAIQNEAAMFARNVTTTGYAKSLQTADGKEVTKRKITEFVSHEMKNLFGEESRSLNLPIKEAPEPAMDSLEEWTSPLQHGFDPKKSERVKGRNVPADATKALQAAIDSGKSTIYLPLGVWRISDTIVVRKNVKRIIGCEARLESPPEMADKPFFRIEDGSSEVVVIERLRGSYGRRPSVFVEHRSKRTVVIRNTTVYGEKAYTNSGGGDLFLEDVCGGHFEFGKQNVWARQLNVENQGTHISNNGGNLWILGYKTERGGTLLHTLGGGKSEVVGGFVYSTSGPKTEPMIRIDDGSRASVTLRESCFNKNPFQIMVQETRGEETKKLGMNDVPRRTFGGLLTLYSGGK